MDFSFLKIQFIDQDANVNLNMLRTRLLDFLLLSSVIIGAGILLAALGPAISNGLYALAAFYSLSYLWLLAITFIKTLPYPLRTNSWLLILYILGVINLFMSGFNVDSGLFFLTLIAMSTLLNHLRAGLSVLALTLVTIGSMAYVIVQLGYTLPLGLPQTDAMLWVIGGTIFFLMGLILAVSLNAVLTGMSLNLARVTTLADELRQKNEALFESEARYRILVETLPDAILLAGMDLKVLMANRACQVLLGYDSPDELVGMNVPDLVHEMNNPGVNDQWMNILNGGKIRDDETEMLRKDGQTVTVEFSVSPILDASGKQQAIIGVGKDITKRKIAEHLLIDAKAKLEQRTEQLLDSQAKMQELAGKIITAQEQERRSISRELHDDAGQTLMTFKLILNSLLDDLPEQHEYIRERLLEVSKQVDRIMALIRSVSHRLRPPALEIGGLNLSLAELIRECNHQTEIKIHYDGQELPGLPDDIAICLYRVTQEAIANILKHAEASQVEIKLRHNTNEIVLSVLDNGRGASFISATGSGIGLLGMRERLSLVGGTLKVETNPGHGYQLAAVVPWKLPPGRQQD